jgi:hypothetical protein
MPPKAPEMVQMTREDLQALIQAEIENAQPKNLNRRDSDWIEDDTSGVAWRYIKGTPMVRVFRVKTGAALALPEAAWHDVYSRKRTKDGMMFSITPPPLTLKLQQMQDTVACAVCDKPMRIAKRGEMTNMDMHVTSRHPRSEEAYEARTAKDARADARRAKVMVAAMQQAGLTAGSA